MLDPPVERIKKRIQEQRDERSVYLHQADCCRVAIEELQTLLHEVYGGE